MATMREKREMMIGELVERHGWVDIGSLRGMVEVDEDSTLGSIEFGAVDVGALLPLSEFKHSIITEIDLEKVKEIRKVFILIVGPDLIYFTDHFLEMAFSELTIGIEIGSTMQTFQVVKDGRVNKREVLLMGEITEWMIYFLKNWESISPDISKVRLEIAGKTNSPPRSMEFGIGAFLKTG